MIKNQECSNQLRRLKKSFDNFVVIHKKQYANIPVRISDRCMHIRRLNSDYVILAINDSEFYELMDVL